MNALNVPQLQRCDASPIIHPALCDSIGNNINGPSLIAVPDWLPNPLGRYYLYFAHHNGKFIRLAYADHVTGPWSIYKPGVLPLTDSFFEGHIASPDVHVDHDRKKIRLYFHGSDNETDSISPQLTRVAESDDGLVFSTNEEVLATAYMRVFKWDGFHYALTMPGKLSRSVNGLTGFEQGHSIFETGVRHSAVRVVDKRLQIYYSRIGDCPESILYSEMDLTSDWGSWSAPPGVKVLEPEMEYEGAQAERIPSVIGIAKEPVWQLRDPAVFTDKNESWLLYSVAGEQGIALARIIPDFDPE